MEKASAQKIIPPKKCPINYLSSCFLWIFKIAFNLVLNISHFCSLMDFKRFFKRSPYGLRSYCCA